MRRLPLRSTSVVIAAVLATSAMSSPARAAEDRVSFTRWTSGEQLSQGSLSNAVVSGSSVKMSGGTTASWTSPWVETGYPATTLVPSWDAAASTGSWLRVDVRVRSGSTTGSWDTLADWAVNVSPLRRVSGTTQSDDLARVAVDTVVANAGRSFDAYQIKVTLRRTATSKNWPVLGAVNAVAASYATRSPATSATTMTRTVDLAVPASSQMIHRSHQRSYDGGGAAWCSPTSTVMVERYFSLGPPASAYAWTKEKEGYVDHTARYSYDYRYEGTGNWGFTTALAGRYGSDAFVTRLTSLRDAEAFVKAGIPLVAGIAFAKGGLTGAPLTSTPGHMVVVRGFTADGAVIVNDPAAPSNSSVKRTYSRAQFEKAWQKGSGGIVYVLHPRGSALPADTARW